MIIRNNLFNRTRIKQLTPTNQLTCLHLQLKPYNSQAHRPIITLNKKSSLVIKQGGWGKNIKFICNQGNANSETII